MDSFSLALWGKRQYNDSVNDITLNKGGYYWRVCITTPLMVRIYNRGIEEQEHIKHVRRHAVVDIKYMTKRLHRQYVPAL